MHERPHSLVAHALSGLVGVVLVAVCLLAAVVALSAFLLLIGQSSSSASLLSPEDSLLTALGGLFTIVLLGIAIRYAYYYYCWFVSRRYFSGPKRIDIAALQARELPHLKFQVTTKGGALPVVERSLRVLESICENHPWLRARVSAEVITERVDESWHLRRAFASSVLELTAITLPPEYATPNGTRLKARALHHMVELRLDGFNAKPGRTFIVHLDEETVIGEPHVMILVDYLTRDPKAITQGPILYPLEWAQTPWICRAIESTRPFGCSECARVMVNPPPPHLHGSNLVVDEAVENQVGWDFGTIDGQPFVAEDLLFGLRAYAILGEGAFGWHGATALEQPPLSLFWAVQQRLRWVLGALQGLRAMWVQRDYDAMPRRKKLRLSLSVYSRIATYSLGFPIGLTGLVFVFHPIAYSVQVTSPFFLLRVALLLSAFAWIASYQIGMRRNLLYQSLPLWEQARHHLVMLVITPVVGLCETVGPFVALARWMLGSRGAQWTPTPKLADRAAPVEESSAQLELPLAPPPPVAPMPAWLLAMRATAAAATVAVPREHTAPRPRTALRPARPAPSPMLTAGRIAAAFGLAVALFAGYEFAITGIFYDRSQRTLLASFKQDLPAGRLASSGTEATEGDPIALLKIPSAGVEDVVVEGSSPEDLKDGPGLLRGSPMPGELGNVVIVGRRTTYGGPFRDLDRLTRGDQVTVTTGQGAFVYQVSEIMHTGAGQADPLDGSVDSRLTLVTSDPAYFPGGRLSVVAKLRGAPVAVPDRPRVPVSASELGLAGDPYGLGLALFWGLAIAAAAWTTWWLARRWPARVRHLLATPVLLALTVLVFTSLDRLLPGAL